MRGSHEVSVTRKRGTNYRFTVRRNITIVRGDSGTGKTTLYEMIADHTRLGDQSGVSIQCDCPCVALTDSDWKSQLSGFENSIVFIDEGLKDLLTHDFAKAVEGSSNYFVIITRACLPALSYSVDEIYRIKTSGKYHSLVPMYPNRGACRYSLSAAAPKHDFDFLLTVDSQSGFQFFERRFADSDIQCEPAGSNASILNWLDEHPDDAVFVIADGAAFGAYIDRVLKLKELHRDSAVICLPESFEWLLLESGAVKSAHIDQVLSNPGDYIESSEYVSWERFFTYLLKKETAGTPFAYSKSELADSYSVERNASKAMALIACRNVR